MSTVLHIVKLKFRIVSFMIKKSMLNKYIVTLLRLINNYFPNLSNLLQKDIFQNLPELNIPKQSSDFYMDVLFMLFVQEYISGYLDNTICTVQYTAQLH